MKLYDECLPCLLRQAVEATKMSTHNREAQQTILDEALKLLMHYKDYQNSPELCRDIHRIMKEISGCDDPYKQIKARDTLLACQLSGAVEAFIEEGKSLSKEDDNTSVTDNVSTNIPLPDQQSLPMELADEAKLVETFTNTGSTRTLSDQYLSCDVSMSKSLPLKLADDSCTTSNHISVDSCSSDNSQHSIDKQAKNATQNDKLYRVLKSAAVGNVLDSAIGLDQKISGQLESELEQPFAICDIEVFRARLLSAKSVLVIGDNAGETVFDGLMLKYLSSLDLQITYAVRHAPIINDAVMDDALSAGLDQFASIISTGSDVPGVKLDECSKDFLEVFEQADLIISKGQGNYETLSDGKRDIFYLLKAKCPVVAGLLHVHQGDFVFKYIGNSIE